MSTQSEFQLHHEAAEELKRLAAHPVREVDRLEHQAREGETASSLLIVVAGVFVGVSLLAALLYGFVLLVTWLLEGS